MRKSGPPGQSLNESRSLQRAFDCRFAAGAGSRGSPNAGSRISVPRDTVSEAARLWIHVDRSQKSKRTDGFFTLMSVSYLSAFGRDLSCQYLTILRGCDSTEDALLNLSCWLKPRTRAMCGFAIGSSRAIGQILALSIRGVGQPAR